MIPKVRFGYSSFYDTILSRPKKIKYNPKGRKGEIFAKKMQKEWDKHEKKILTSMSKITGLKWPRKYIDCYVSFNSRFSFSHPLTLEINKQIECNIDNLVHELAHILLWDNEKNVRRPESGYGIYRKYKKECYNTKLHFSTQALVILTMKKVFGQKAEKYLKWERWWKIWPKYDMADEYKRSWEIVQKEGPENVLRQIIKTKK